MRRYVLFLTALLLGLTACTPAERPATPTASPPVIETPAPSVGVDVHTDWSKLTPRPAPLPEVGRRWYEDYTDTLIPRSDYGELVPYAGLRLLDSWPAYNGCMYGLMTRQGVAVTDAVFSTVVFQPREFPLLVLQRVEGIWMRTAVAGADGSWCTDFDYRFCQVTSEGLLLFGEDSLTLMAPDGTLLEKYGIETLGLTRQQLDEMIDSLSWGETHGVGWYGDYIDLGWTDELGESNALYQRSAARRMVMPTNQWYALDTAGYERPADGWEVLSVPGETVLTRGAERRVIPFGVEDGNIEVWENLVLFQSWGAAYTLDGAEVLPPEKGVWMRSYGDERAALLLICTHNGENGSARTAYYLADGTPVTMLDNWDDLSDRREYRQVSIISGLIEVLDWDTASYYDPKTLECIFRTYLGYDDI